MAPSNKQKIKDAVRTASKRKASVVEQAGADNALLGALTVQFYRGGSQEAEAIGAIRAHATPMRFMAMFAEKLLSDYGTGTLRRFLVGMAQADT